VRHAEARLRAALADGTEVVVKVQYPGVEENLDGDMQNLKTLLSLGSIVGYRKRDLDGMFEEIRDRLDCLARIGLGYVTLDRVRYGLAATSSTGWKNCSRSGWPGC
jgi:excinuclease UvrABC ATPase subunit